MGWLLTLKRRFKVEESTRHIYCRFAETSDKKTPPYILLISSVLHEGMSFCNKNSTQRALLLQAFYDESQKRRFEGLSIDDELVDRLERNAIS